MGESTVIILHQPPEGGGPLSALVHDARARLAERQVALFHAAGANQVMVERRARAPSFGARLDALVAAIRGGLVLLGAGAVPRLRASDAARLLEAARGDGPIVLTNNRYSSDVLAVTDASLLGGLGAASDNELPRRLAQRGVAIVELPDHERLAFDLDTPLDLAILASLPDAPGGLQDLVAASGLSVPRHAELRSLARDRQRELLVFGRTSARTLAWLERRTACRVRFLAEERGLRTATRDQRPPRATLGRLLDLRGPAALGAVVAELADGAVLDTRVLLADRLGRDDAAWPSAEDRYASDLLRPDLIGDPWLRALTESAARAARPILLGGHTTVGPALPWLLRA